MHLILTPYACHHLLNVPLKCREIGGNPKIHLDPDAEKKYLGLEHLGEVLKDLSSLPGELRILFFHPALEAFSQ